MEQMFEMDQVAAGTVPEALTGVRWAHDVVECRFRILHPDGSLVAAPGERGTMLTDPSVSCDRCSEACG